MKKRVKNPLIHRIPKDFLSDWRKYFVVSLFLILMIGFVSGMYVANSSMMTSAEEGIIKYKLEDGHFELNEPAEDDLIQAIQYGELGELDQFYVDRAKWELDERFDEEFFLKFKEQFDIDFDSQFEASFKSQLMNLLLSQGISAESAQAVLSETFAQTKREGIYQEAYDKAYDEAFQNAYEEAYQNAYDEAWDEILIEIEDQLEEAKERYGLNDPDFEKVSVTVYENFYRNEEEDHDSDGIADGTIRVFKKTDEINLACLMEGRFPSSEKEIAVDRMHADNVGIHVGDEIVVGNQKWQVVGLLAYVNYSTLHEKSSDFMFDAINFNVGMVTEEGFDRLSKAIHYSYAWLYENSPENEMVEKHLSDDFLKVLLTQTAIQEVEISDYLPRYANPAINFATDDMGSDEAMGGVLLDILIVIIAFIFAVTITNTIIKESRVIGTLRASGYTRKELVLHYLTMPVIVTLVSAVVGNILGYTVFKNVVISMYYNSYSLPTYQTIWNWDAFIKTTFIPIILMFVVNLFVIVRMMNHSPLQFLRHDLKKSKRKKAIRLPRWKFFSRFRLRIIFQNASNYLVLFLGIFFIMVMLAMAVGMPDTLSYYKENATNMMFSKYQTILKNYENEEGDLIETQIADAEIFGLYALQRKSDVLDEEISVYGILDNSRYISIENLSSLKENQVYISDSFRDKYKIKIGDVITLDEKYENKQLEFEVVGYVDSCLTLGVFMPIENYRDVFDLDANAFSGYLSDTEITDILEDDIAMVITERDITKMCDQLDHSMGSYMKYFQLLCILLSSVMIYLLTKIIIEKNENAISMTKILGYENKEIAMLYLLATSFVLVVADAVSVWLGTIVMGEAWKMIMAEYSGWFPFMIQLLGYVKMFVFVLVGYLIVLCFDFRRIKKIPMDKALKDME